MKSGISLKLLLALLLLNGLAAYAVFGIPLQWIANLGVLAAGSLLLAVKRERLPGAGPLVAFLLYAGVLNAIVLLTEGAGRRMPLLATTPYLPFIGLRYATFAVFLVAAGCSYYECCRGRGRLLINGITGIAILLSLFALYVYAAHIYGLPEPPRSRMGTTGGEQAVRFSYQFHRAMGSFREPSHLAEWLIAPFYLSLLRRGRWAWIGSTIIALAMVLTGSLTGMVSVTGGLALAFLWLRSPREMLRLSWSYALPAAGAVVLFSVIAVSYSDDRASLAGTLWSRIEPIFESGSLRTTNRAAVYNYLEAFPPDAYGRGLGNANLDFGSYAGSATVPSFLSLYWNTLYSAGYAGLFLLGWFLLRPLWRQRFARQRARREDLLLTAAYLSYLIAFGVHAEELPFQFGLLFGLFAYYQRSGVAARAAIRNYAVTRPSPHPGADGLLPARP